MKRRPWILEYRRGSEWLVSATYGTEKAAQDQMAKFAEDPYFNRYVWRIRNRNAEMS